MRNSILLALLVTVAIPVAVATADQPKKKGFWCWTHPDGSVALCARRNDQCEASREGFNQVERSLGEPEVPSCEWQKTAWEFVTKRPMGPGHHYPTKQLCTKKIADRSERCRLAR